MNAPASRTRVNAARTLGNEHVANARLVPGRYQMLHVLGPLDAIVEVGVAYGDFSKDILKLLQPRKFVGIDVFGLEKLEFAFGARTADTLKGLTHEEFYRRRFAQEAERGIVEVRRGLSHEVLQDLADAAFDMIYIDAAHDYESVKRDLHAAKRKLKPNGYLVVNDYVMSNPFTGQTYGVVQATNELCIEDGWEVRFLALHPFMFCDAALQKIP